MSQDNDRADWDLTRGFIPGERPHSKESVLELWQNHHILDVRLPEPYRSRQLEHMSPTQIAKVYGAEFAAKRAAEQAAEEAELQRRLESPQGPIFRKPVPEKGEDE